MTDFLHLIDAMHEALQADNAEALQELLTLVPSDYAACIVNEKHASPTVMIVRLDQLQALQEPHVVETDDTLPEHLYEKVK